MQHNQRAKKGWRGMLQLLLAAQSSQELDKLFQLFLTEEERDDLAGRYLIVQALLKGEKPQREIAEDLQVSISKITRGSNGLKRIDSQLRTFMQSRMTDI